MKKKEIVCFPKLRVIKNDTDFFVIAKNYIHLVANSPDFPHNTVRITLPPKYRDRIETILKFLNENALILKYCTLSKIEVPERNLTYLQIYATAFSCFKKNVDLDAVRVIFFKSFITVPSPPDSIYVKSGNLKIGLRFVRKDLKVSPKKIKQSLLPLP